MYVCICMYMYIYTDTKNNIYTYSYKARGVTEVKTIGSQAAREGSVGNLCCTIKCLKVRLLTRRMHGHVKYTCPQQYVHIYSYIYTHVRHKRRSRRLLRNNESHRRKPCKKKLKIKMRNIWEHVTHPHSHNPLFRLWGHASKSRQLNGGVRPSQQGGKNESLGG